MEFTAAFALVLVFSDWDECWNYAHKIGATSAYMTCESVQIERPSLAPITSLRPVARPQRN